MCSLTQDHLDWGQFEHKLAQLQRFAVDPTKQTKFPH